MENQYWCYQGAAKNLDAENTRRQGREKIQLLGTPSFHGGNFSRETGALPQNYRSFEVVFDFRDDHSRSTSNRGEIPVFSRNALKQQP